jgi:hypothetical protein
MSSHPVPTKNSSRKRKAAIDDNGEPVKLDKKKARGTQKGKATTKSSATGKAPTIAPTILLKTIPTKTLPVAGSTSSQQVREHLRKSSSVEIEDIPDEDNNPHSFLPHNCHHILESVDSSTDKNGDLPHSTTDVNTEDMDHGNATENSPEDEDAELGQFFLLSHKNLLKFQ